MTGAVRVDFHIRVLTMLGVLAAALSLAVGTKPAHAQVPAVLEEMKLVTADDQQAAFILRFSPQEPKAETPSGGPGSPVLVLRNSFRSPAVPAQANFRGLVRTVHVQANKGDLALQFITTAPSHIVVEPAETNVVQVKIRKVTAEEALGSRPFGSSDEPVQKASDFAAPTRIATSDDSYEMIMLRYADVSEVIGLLGEGSTIEPNNVFIRREPGFGSLGTGSQTSFLPPATQDPRRDNPLGQSFANGLAVDRRLNAIWVTGSRERIERVRQQIAMIDVPVDSVILETQFVELTETGARNLGIDLTNNAGQIAVGRLETGSLLPFNVNPNDILPTGALQAAIYAQVEKGEGRILSRPRIAA